ncbi:TerD family protein [Streptomyces pactum]|uniref:TerD family protein n=1 Tax=Streptomyces pactum TaxID=68249 RepID=UPI0036FC6AA0
MTQIIKGGNVPLSGEPMRVAVVRRSGGPGVPDIDAAALLVAADGTVRDRADLVFYNQPEHAASGVRLLGNVRGEDGVVADWLEFDPGRVEPSVDRIVIAASCDGGTFGDVAGLYLRAVSAATGEQLAMYTIDDATTETAILLGEFYRRNGGWKFRAVGQGYDSGLPGLAADFGFSAPGEGPEPDEAPAPDGAFAPHGNSAPDGTPDPDGSLGPGPTPEAAPAPASAPVPFAPPSAAAPAGAVPFAPPAPAPVPFGAPSAAAEAPAAGATAGSATAGSATAGGPAATGVTGVTEPADATGPAAGAPDPAPGSPLPGTLPVRLNDLPAGMGPEFPQVEHIGRDTEVVEPGITLPRGFVVVDVLTREGGFIEVTTLTVRKRRWRNVLTSRLRNLRGVGVFHHDGNTPIRLRVDARGQWMIRLRPVSTLRPFDGPLEGHGPEVLAHAGDATDVKCRFLGDEEKDGYFGLHLLRRGGHRDFVCSRLGRGRSSGSLPAGPRLVVVEAAGGWSLEPRPAGSGFWSRRR